MYEGLAIEDSGRSCGRKVRMDTKLMPQLLLALACFVVYLFCVFGPVRADV